MAITSCLVDTNILLRIARRSDPQHKLIDAAFAKLALEGTGLHYTHRNIASPARSKFFWLPRHGGSRTLTAIGERPGS